MRPCRAFGADFGIGLRPISLSHFPAVTGRIRRRLRRQILTLCRTTSLSTCSLRQRRYAASSTSFRPLRGAFRCARRSSESVGSEGLSGLLSFQGIADGAGALTAITQPGLTSSWAQMVPEWPNPARGDVAGLGKRGGRVDHPNVSQRACEDD